MEKEHQSGAEIPRSKGGNECSDAIGTNEASSDGGFICKGSKSECFQELVNRCSALSITDIAEVHAIMLEAKENGLGNLEISILSERCAEAMDVTIGSIRTVMKDIDARHPTHGDLHDSTAVVDALLDEEGGYIVTVGGVVHTYNHPGEGELSGTWQPETDDELQRYLMKEFKSQAPSTAARREIISKLKVLTAVDDGAFVMPAPGLCLNNGQLVRNEDGRFELTGHSPEHRARNKLAIDYDPEAVAPGFEAGLLRIVDGCTTKLNAILEFMACAVFGRRPEQDHVRGCMLLVGPPRSGKSTILNLVAQFFIPSQVTSLSPDRWSKAEDVVMLAGAGLNVVPEIDPHRRINGTQLKKVLSGEPVTGRVMRQNSITFVPNVMNIWAANQLPRISEQDASIARRFLIIRMGEALSDEEAATDFFDVIESEAAGVINVLCRAFAEVQRRGHFVLPEDNQFTVARMQFGDDLAGLWTRTQVKRQAGSRITADEVYAGLTALAEELGIDPETITSGTRRRVAENLYKEFGATRRKVNGKPHYEGVTLSRRPRQAPATCGGDDSPRPLREVALEDL